MHLLTTKPQPPVFSIRAGIEVLDSIPAGCGVRAALQTAQGYADSLQEPVRVWYDDGDPDTDPIEDVRLVDTVEPR